MLLSHRAKFTCPCRLQAALSVQLPRAAGGLDGEAVFIDTEGSFMIQRVVDMAGVLAEAHDVERDALLKGLHYYRPHDYQELHEVVKEMDTFCHERPKECVQLE